MLSDDQRRFLYRNRVGRLATADNAGRPHVVPVCYAVHGTTLYITIDEKPKKLERSSQTAAQPDGEPRCRRHG